MEVKCQYFRPYIASKMHEIPKKHLLELIDEFASNAKFYMSSEEDSKTTAKINEAIAAELKDKFRFLPLHLVAEAYDLGAKGELGGTTRFTFRNVYTWLKGIEEKNQRLKQLGDSKIDNERKRQNEIKFKESQSRSMMFGSALYKKIEWCYAGLLSADDYDMCTIEKMVALMDQGYKLHEITPKMILR